MKCFVQFLAHFFSLFFFFSFFCLFFFLTVTNYKHTFVVLKGKPLNPSCTLQSCTNHPELTQPPALAIVLQGQKKDNQQPRTWQWLRCPPQGPAGGDNGDGVALWGPCPHRCVALAGVMQ